jgi:signal transduction histidine kinase
MGFALSGCGMPGPGLISHEPSTAPLRPARPEPVTDTLPSGPGPHFVEIRTLCQAVVEALADRARRQRVTLDLVLAAQPVYVIGYVDRLYQVVFHLVINALAAMPKGGQVTLRVTRRTAVTIECLDTGPGVRPQDVPHLWDACDRIKGGGLPVTHAIVEAHRGRLSYRPGAGTGACFTIELPAAGPRR